MLINQSVVSSKTAGVSNEGETADTNEDATVMSETSNRMGNEAFRKPWEC